MLPNTDADDSPCAGYWPATAALLLIEPMTAEWALMVAVAEPDVDMRPIRTAVPLTDTLDEPCAETPTDETPSRMQMRSRCLMP